MNVLRALVALAACMVLVVVLLANPSTHAMLRKAAYAAGLLHPVPPLRTGAAFPALSVEQLDGRRAQWQGAAIHGTVVYNVFTSWCPSCRDEAHAFAQAAPLLRKHGIAVIGIDQGEPVLAVERFAGDFGIDYPVVIDPDSSTTAVLSARVIPETIVVRNGIVQQIAVGPVSLGFLDRVAERV